MPPLPLICSADLQLLELRQARQGAEIREIQVIALQRQGREAGGALNALQALQAGYAEASGFQLRHIPQEGDVGEAAAVTGLAAIHRQVPQIREVSQGGRVFDLHLGGEGEVFQFGQTGQRR